MEFFYVTNGAVNAYVTVHNGFEVEEFWKGMDGWHIHKWMLGERNWYELLQYNENVQILYELDAAEYKEIKEAARRFYFV